MISWTWCTVPKSKVLSEGQPTWKVGHCALQKVINLFFFTSTDRFCALDLKSEKWSVLRDKGVEVVCPMITEKNTGDQMSTQRAETVPALTQTQQTDNKCTSAKSTGLGLPGPPFFNLFLPLRVSYQQDVHRASRLPSTMLGLGLTLDLTRKHRCSETSPPSEETPSSGRVLFFPVKGIPDEPPDVMPRV